MAEHFKEVKNSMIDSSGEIKGKNSTMGSPYSIVGIQSFDIWQESQTNRINGNNYTGRSDIVSGPLGSIHSHNRALSNWVIIYEDQL